MFDGTMPAMPAMPTTEERTRDRPILETARLRLRRPDAGDIASIVAIAGDWDVARRLSRVPHPYAETDFRFFLDTIVPTEWTWAITFRASGELIGMTGLTPQPAHDVAELGYYVARPHWGIGIATEAARAVVEYGLRVAGLARLTSGHFLDNPASGRVLRKLGFVEVGRTERHCLASGSTAPSIEMRLDGVRFGSHTGGG
jgi:RimJ/RimL family protein N-acetyltransferase